MENPKLLSPLQLAFYGDAVYEQMVRRYLLEQGAYPAGQLHKMSTSLVCAKAQSKGAKAILGLLSKEELTVFKRGRNAHPSHSPKSASGAEYAYATAVECLFGYLNLKHQEERLYELFKIMINSID